MTPTLIALSLLLTQLSQTPQEAQNQANIKAAKQCVQDFFQDFNAEDNDALQAHMTYPHIFLTRNGQVRILEERWDMNFDAMKEREGWTKSTIDSLEACQVFQDKVHLNLIFSRINKDGKIYRTVPGQWIITKKDNQWGVQLRSY